MKSLGKGSIKNVTHHLKGATQDECVNAFNSTTLNLRVTTFTQFILQRKSSTVCKFDYIQAYY